MLGGVHIGTTKGLQSPYSIGTAIDVSGDFATHDVHRVGFFIGAGFDFNIFRKLFGSVTNVGTTRPARRENNPEGLIEGQG